MGQDEDPAPAVACARLSRSEQARLWRVTHAAKAFGDVGKSHGEVPFDVFAEDPLGFDFAGDPGDLGPKMPRIIGAAAIASVAEGLAWITGSEDMNAAAPRAAVKGSQIVPDKRLTQGLVAHPRHESGRRVGFPLDECHSAISGLGDVEPEIEPPISGAKGYASEVMFLRHIAGR
ncbi:MAG: hypothetical protein JWQ16_1743 [Novosphingobium sp.]|nr:hypothetical protein [Novosphingobium sp.]